MSKYDEKHKAYTSKYNADKYDTILIRVPKGEKAVYQEEAKKARESLNEYINRIIRKGTKDMRYEMKKKIVESGDSKIFENWKQVAEWQGYELTKEDFLDALKWLCDDPMDGGKTGTKLTREIGLEKNGIVRLDRVYGVQDFCVFSKDGRTWSGAILRVPCDKPDFADPDGMINTNVKLTLSARDWV